MLSHRPARPFMFTARSSTIEEDDSTRRDHDQNIMIMITTTSTAGIYYHHNNCSLLSSSKSARFATYYSIFGTVGIHSTYISHIIINCKSLQGLVKYSLSGGNLHAFHCLCGLRSFPKLRKERRLLNDDGVPKRESNVSFKRGTGAIICVFLFFDVSFSFVSIP